MRISTPVKTSSRKLTVTIKWVLLTQPACGAAVGGVISGDTG